MPTVLANVNDLLEKGVLEETGEYASTGGRKAKSIGINKSYCHAMGILITANHIEMVLVNLGDEIIKKDRIRLKFTAELSYCTAARIRGCWALCRNSPKIQPRTGTG